MLRNNSSCSWATTGALRSVLQAAVTPAVRTGACSGGTETRQRCCWAPAYPDRHPSVLLRFGTAYRAAFQRPLGSCFGGEAFIPDAGQPGIAFTGQGYVWKVHCRSTGPQSVDGFFKFDQFITHDILQKGRPGAAISGTIIFYLLRRSKSIPYLPATAVEILRISAVFRREIRKALSAPGDIEIRIHRRFRSLISKQGIDAGNLRELFRIMLLQIPKEEICVAGQKLQEEARFSTPILQNVFVAIRPCEVHFHQREMIDEQGIFVLSALLLSSTLNPMCISWAFRSCGRRR